MSAIYPRLLFQKPDLRINLDFIIPITLETEFDYAD
jgi:hypothetical protein